MREYEQESLRQELNRKKQLSTKSYKKTLHTITTKTYSCKTLSQYEEEIKRLQNIITELKTKNIKNSEAVDKILSDESLYVKCKDCSNQAQSETRRVLEDAKNKFVQDVKGKYSHLRNEEQLSKDNSDHSDT